MVSRRTRPAALLVAALLLSFAGSPALARRAPAGTATVAQLLRDVARVDRYTMGHSVRVGTYSRWIARELGMTRARQSAVGVAGALHDAGKVQVPASIIRKPGKLSGAERAEMDRHPAHGAAIISRLARPAWQRRLAQTVAASHHERWDGKGYPLGLKGRRIAKAARIVAVADAFDAMTTQRSYNEPMSARDAVRELRRGAGTQFDPEMVEALARALGLPGSP